MGRVEWDVGEGVRVVRVDVVFVYGKGGVQGMARGSLKIKGLVYLRGEVPGLRCLSGP